MKLQGIEFGSAFCSSGTRNFDGSGWPYHRYLPWRSVDWSGSTLVTKTTTVDARTGHMILKDDGLTPIVFKPDCINVSPLSGITLNSVALSGPGAAAVLQMSALRAHNRPFLFSFMSAEHNAEDRLRDAYKFVHIMRSNWPIAHRPIGIEINFSCPNVAHGGKDRHWHDWCEEIRYTLVALSVLGVPLVPNFSVETPPELIKWVMLLPECDAVSVANTLHFSSALLDRQKLFGTEISPLARFGGGGLSGPPLFPLLIDWLGLMMREQPTKPLIVGGGVFSKEDVRTIYRLARSIVRGVKLGTVGLYRPWRVQGMIREINRLFGGVK